MQVLLDIHCEVEIDGWEDRFAQEVVSLVQSDAHQKFGVFTEKVLEPTCTSVFSSLLQEYCPDPGILWCHQFMERDVCGLARCLDEFGNVGYELRVIWEFSTRENSKDKEHQLFAYVNNFNEFARTSQWFISLGVIVILGTSFRLQGFYPVRIDKSYKLAVVNIYEGLWNTADVAKLMHAIQKFMVRPSTDFLRPMNLDSSLFNRNIIVVNADEVKSVYKVFDGRFRIGRMFRKHDAYLIFMERTVILLDVELRRGKKLVVISYPYIEGTHYPADSNQIIEIIDQLQVIHNKNYVHGDIRLSNLIFSSKGSKIIDFDFCDMSGTAVYPPTFETNINDGKRHVEVGGNKLITFAHDHFALSEALRLLEVSSADSDAWTTILGLICEGDLSAACEELRKYKIEFQYKLVAAGEFGTGITPEKRYSSPFTKNKKNAYDDDDDESNVIGTRSINNSTISPLTAVANETKRNASSSTGSARLIKPKSNMMITRANTPSSVSTSVLPPGATPHYKTSTTVTAVSSRARVTSRSLHSKSIVGTKDSSELKPTNKYAASKVKYPVGEASLYKQPTK